MSNLFKKNLGGRPLNQDKVAPWAPWPESKRLRPQNLRQFGSVRWKLAIMRQQNYLFSYGVARNEIYCRI